MVTLGHPPDPRFPNGYNPNAAAAAAAAAGGAEPPPNFAQAALLLQNSSSVYSRKVEYLHALVYQALNDLIASTRNGGNGKAGQKRRGGGSGTEAILEELTEYDENMEFLLLDDVLPTDDSPDGDRINLREDDARANANLDLLLDEDDDDDDNHAGHNNNRSLLAATPRNNQSLLNATRLSLGGLSVTRLDRSKAGSILGAGSSSDNNRMSSEAATRALIGTILNEGSDGQGNLRLLSGKCDVSSTGALLMPGSSLLTTGGSAGGDGDGRNSGMSINPNSSLFVAEDGDNNMGGGDDNGNFAHADDDDDDGGVGFALADDDDDADTFAQAQQQQQASAPKKVQFAPIPAKKHDPWALLDPHDAGAVPKARPLRIGVTYRLPPGVDDTPSECVTGARTKKKRSLRKTTMMAKNAKAKMLSGAGGRRALDTFVSVAAYKSSRAAAGANLNGDSDEEMDEEEAEALAEVASSVSMTGLAFGTEFAYIAKATARREAAARREERKRRQMEEAGLPPPPAGSGDQGNFAAFDDDDDDYGGGFAFGGDDDDDDLDENDAGPVRGNVGVTSLDEAISTAGSQFGSGDGEYLLLDIYFIPCSITFHSHSAALNLFHSQNSKQTRPTSRARPLRSCAEPTLGLSQEAPRSTPPRRSLAVASEIGKAAYHQSSKRKRRDQSSTFIATAIGLWRPSRKKWNRRRLRTVIGSLPLRGSRPLPTS